ncbi:Lrp/AsnC family leucine-responsive transcriptional regulator [Maribacter vaceletii]|uniref:Lrp/AsnC family leucine-responsive transcriptional regulator n=1 Tax=Maribacter vaceletii TaxID=1206816 RepID=A0A495E982_9FLAO|nr:Lrp/AsnC family transcriptional regulator [Maribacter vaceletii]RKR13053.1 Lrp/AsnC family leucine-responsive transcriptional regulator [Maribacter vaceletii]
MQTLDAIDKKLLNELQEDGKQSIKQLAQKVNLSITPTHERIKRIEASGIIKKYVALIDPESININLVVYCQVTLAKHQEDYFKEFEAYINTLEEVQEVCYIAGAYDYLLKIVLRDMKEYQEFILDKISQLKIVSNLQSSFVIRQLKDETKIKIK